MQLKSISYFIGLSLFNLATYAEPPLQAGDTIESLSKVHIQTSINGQSGSIQDLVDSGQIQLINTSNTEQPTLSAALNPIHPPQDQSTRPSDGAKTSNPAVTPNSTYPRPAEPGDIIPLPSSQSGQPSTEGMTPSSDIPETPDHDHNSHDHGSSDKSNTSKYGQPDLATPIP